MIFVDDLTDWGWKKGASSHLWSDGDEAELIAFGAKIGLNARWLHRSKGITGAFVHFDVTEFKRNLALQRGAVYKPLREYIRERNKEKTT